MAATKKEKIPYKKAHKRKVVSSVGKEDKPRAKFFELFKDSSPMDTAYVIAGLVLLLLFFFLFFSCVSYLFTISSDQSILRSGSFAFGSADYAATNVHNILGPCGAYVADALMNGFLGIGSFFLILFLGYLSIELIAKRSFRLFYRLRFFIVCSLLAIWVSLFCESLSVIFGDRASFHWGGKHGAFLFEHLYLNFSALGIFLLLLFSFVIIFILFMPRTKSLLKKVFLYRFHGKKKKKKEEEGIVSPTSSSDSVAVVPLSESEDIPKGEEEAEAEATSSSSSSSSPSLSYPLSEKEKEADREPHKNVAVSTDEKSATSIDVRVAKGDAEPAAVSDCQKSVSCASYQYCFPPLPLLHDDSDSIVSLNREEIEKNKNLILETIKSFNIDVIPVHATVGPTITLYEIRPSSGVKISRIRNLDEDIALKLKVAAVRIIAPLPKKGTIGLEVPNSQQQSVGLRSLLASKKFQETDMQLPIAMGRSITNDVFMFDLTKMPHLLIAGATGQGKSVGMNVIITSLLYSKSPDELKFVMIDPKVLEFSIYEPLEHHYFTKIPSEKGCIISDPEKVQPTLNSLCKEMDERYTLLSDAKVRDIVSYNELFKQGALSGRVENGREHRLLPYIVLVDEFADLIMTGGKEIEKPISRLAQKARAAGIHMILATQRPSTNIVTGTIKANFPARIAFKVFSKVDSTVILDSTGANQLIGRGDMLFFQGKEMVRVQCAFVDTPETERIVAHIANQPKPLSEYSLPEPDRVENEAEDSSGGGDVDPLFEDAARSVVQSHHGSTSKIQRDFEIGFNRAARIMDQLERHGIVGRQIGSKPREVLIHDPESLTQIFYNIRHDL